MTRSAGISTKGATVPTTGLFRVDDYRREAQAILPRGLWNTVCGDGRQHGWETAANNLAAFEATKLRPRVLVDVSEVQLATTVLGQEVGAPVMIAPSGTQQRWHAEGELASARAAARTNTIMALSSASTYSIEEVAAEGGRYLWFQLYFMKHRRLTEQLVRRAEDAGYRAVILTVDRPGGEWSHENDPRLAQRGTEPEYDLESEWKFAPTLQQERILKNFRDTRLDGLSLASNIDVAAQIDDSLTWKDLEWLRALTPLPLVVKGIQHGDDVRLAREHGVEAVVVSNHGGVLLKDAAGTMEILPEAVEAAGGQLEVYLDGGVRRGDDVLKALAVGARAVFIGRAQLWGLAVAGEEGVVHVIEILRKELRQAMRLCGATDARRVPRDLVSVRARS